MNAGKEARRRARQEETVAAAKVSSGATDEDGDGIVDAVEVLE